jgi:hypothetical protein
MNIHTPTAPMSDVQIQSQRVRFPCITWEVQGESIQPVKGTWALPPPHLKHVFDRLGVGEKVRGIVACPNCGHPSILTSDIVTDDKVEHVGVLPILRCAKCPFACEAILESWDTRKLYCVAYETQSGDTIRGNKEYFHGDSAQDVNEQFWAGHWHDKTIINVVGIGLVIGYFVDDAKGLNLHV